MSLPSSIREINDLPENEKHSIYQRLLPDWLFSTYGIDNDTLMADGHVVIKFRCPSGSRALEITVKRRIHDTDPILYLNLTDTFNNQLLVLLVIVNDPESPRFDIDVDENGNKTHLGTNSRNLVAEEAAMKAGLAPGQIKKGLRSFKQSIPAFEDFVRSMGHDLFLIEPLAYHNAISFERYGFNYMRGFQEMVRINQEFQPGGELFSKLSKASVFRSEDCWKTVRGRSWAIHDGILGYPFSGFQMYKHINAVSAVNTFPDAIW
ncbi:MAG: hypothetical protein IT321_00665 [Anaerolineae bacterium]|nr:hypothetical protein [Anaerolineae bacterium]